ncbi:putative transcriptional regulator protein [Salinisphaera shabanensis E1L3A]|uniref:Transcriptional regulator protein n=1 Tax=Salinisphaera shabanensis E1L3A TaxID=1033802 RepID=U2ENR7_9GAMM|nr:AraC family transcriptional regulator [Salinisphaera shabanensis]ERJ19475.1 putative transcriptional regulator protein [Salinisphaera shabanensis E1L3A]
MNGSATNKDWFVHSQTPRLERLEAYFGGHAYDPHRHDTYAVGITLAGVQSFHYRGVHRHSPPNVFQDMLGGQPLPFLPGGITTDTRMAESVVRLLRHIDSPLETFEEDDALFDLASAMNAHAGARPAPRRFDYPAAQRVRAFIDDTTQRSITLGQLEAVSGQNRWRLSRDFRVLFGTSPYRYLTMRRLERCKRRLRAGQTLADAAFDAGFADQSHMTRQFTDAYGIPPGRWLKLTQQAQND